MTPVSPVLPNSNQPEIVLGANQPQYIPLPAVVIDSDSRPMVTRWRLTDAERVRVTFGADIVLQQLTFSYQFQPVNLQVVMPNGMPEFME